MKRILSVRLISVMMIVIVLPGGLMLGQSKETKLADKYFDVEDYYLALENYKEALEIDPDNVYLNYRIAESYRLFFDYVSAEQWYSTTINMDVNNEYPLALFYHAWLLKINGKYNRAEEEFDLFNEAYQSEEPNDKYLTLAQVHIEGCRFALKEITNPKRDYRFELLESNINSTESDFGTTIMENDSSIIIASSRILDEKDDIYGRTGEGFTNLYRFRKDQNGWEALEGDQDGFDKLNTDLNEGVGAFSPDMNKYYFTACNHKSEKTITTCAIYVTKNEKGKWGKPEKLNENINPEGVWNAQPSLSSTGDTLFFVSKREGGFGQHDIWYSVNQGGESWGEPINMGEGVNSQFIEMSPYYDPKGQVLFFATNGRLGFGGLDIYMAKGEDFSDVQNVGLPFNSNRDDFGYVVGDSIGYLTSNRSQGVGSDDIYKFNRYSIETIVDRVNQIDSVNSITIKGRLLKESGDPIANAAIELRNENGELLKTGQTDEEGKYEFSGLEPDQGYKVVLAEEHPTIIESKPLTVDQVVESSTASPQVVGKVDQTQGFVGGRQLFENIYFEFDQDRLRKEAKKIIKDLISFHQKFPKVKIEIRGNTDAIGPDEYNNNLSKRRANSVVDFMVSQGLEKSSLVMIANGEGSPIASNANEIGRQLNRRVEFYVVGQGGDYESKGMVYVTEKEESLAAIADRFGMTVLELKDLNDLTDKKIPAYSPVRVRRTANTAIASATLAYAGASSRHALMHGHNHVDLSKKFNVGEPTKAAYNNGVQYGKVGSDGYYIVLPKNTLFSIAKIAGVSVEELKKMNNLKSNTLIIGQKLRVSSAANKDMYSGDEQLVDYGITISDNEGKIINLDGEIRYVTKEGDTFHSVCDQFNMRFEQLRALNNLSSYMLRPKMVLRVIPDAGFENINIEELKKRYGVD